MYLGWGGSFSPFSWLAPPLFFLTLGLSRLLRGFLLSRHSLSPPDAGTPLLQIAPKRLYYNFLIRLSIDENLREMGFFSNFNPLNRRFLGGKNEKNHQFLLTSRGDPQPLFPKV